MARPVLRHEDQPVAPKLHVKTVSCGRFVQLAPTPSATKASRHTRAGSSRSGFRCRRSRSLSGARRCGRSGSARAIACRTEPDASNAPRRRSSSTLLRSRATELVRTCSSIARDESQAVASELHLHAVLLGDRVQLRPGPRLPQPFRARTHQRHAQRARSFELRRALPRSVTIRSQPVLLLDARRRTGRARVSSS